MGMCSNMFANIENKFEFAEKDEIVGIALNSLEELFEAMDSMEEPAIFGAMVLGAKLGVAGDGVLHQQEKELIDKVFDRIWNGPMEDIYRMVGADIKDSDYNMVETLTKLGNSVAMPFLYYTLSFAYIDGTIEDDVAERLDSLFGMNLLVDFIQSGQEEVPAPKIKIHLTELETEIVSWFKERDTSTMYPLKEIQSHFAGKSNSEIRQALDSLVDKGLLFGGANYVNNMYGLA